MEYNNRNNRNQRYQRDFRSSPYDMGASYGDRGNFRTRENSFRHRGDNFGPGMDNRANFTHDQQFRPRNREFRSHSHANQNYSSRGSYSGRNYNSYNQRDQDDWREPERTFDEKGREIERYDSGSTNRLNLAYRKSEDVSAQSVLSPLEEKAKDFLHTVLSQEGIGSKLIFLETVDSALQTLQGSVDNCQLHMVFDMLPTGEFALKVDGYELARGSFATKQIAKNALAEQAIERLRKDCFYIVKKKAYEEVSAKKNQPKVEAQPQTAFEGSKAHQMMLKMGWGGKGLGVNEQGVEKTVAEALDQNVSRQGLGTDDVFKKIHKLLEDYSKSDKITLLRFDPDFTPEERAHIHKMASKFGLKSKSEGKGDQRRITVTKKLNRSDLVYNLLISDLENDLYKLIIPAKFVHLWNDDEGDEF